MSFFFNIGNQPSFNRDIVFFGIGENVSHRSLHWFALFLRKAAKEICGEGEKGKKEQYARERECKNGIVQNGACPYPKNSLEGQIAKANFSGSGKIVADPTIFGPLLILFLLIYMAHDHIKHLSFGQVIALYSA